MSKTLLKYRRNIYSQNGEDGIIDEIFSRLEIDNGWFVDIGAWDGKYLSNCFALVEQGWKGVEIEGDKEKYKELVAMSKTYPDQIVPVCAYVTDSGENSLDSILTQTSIPQEFELMSIDIDSFDYQVWENTKIYRPKVVIIEINSSYPVGAEIIHSINNSHSGSSFTATLKLGLEKGYRLACHTGNMIFVRSDLMHKIKLPDSEIHDPNQLFVDKWINETNILRIMKHKLDQVCSRY